MLHIYAKIPKVNCRLLYSSPFVETLSLALPNPSMRVSSEQIKGKNGVKKQYI